MPAGSLVHLGADSPAGSSRTNALYQARKQLLEHPSLADRAVLASKLQLVSLKRADEMSAGWARIRQEHVARGLLKGSATILRCWEMAVEAGERARDSTINACIAVGINDEDAVTAFIAEDMRDSLSSFMISRFGHGDVSSAAAAAQYASLAGQLASRVRDQVRNRYFDRRSESLASPEPVRVKHQKFGILDAPNLLADDLAQPEELLGRVLIYLDIDGFKAINTQFLERVVDRTILPEIQRLVLQAVTHNGYAYAEGGDEMIILLPNSSVEMGVALAEALRAAIEEHRFPVEGEEVRLTASFGVAASRAAPHMDLAEAANRAKAHAKSSGKNCVVLERHNEFVIAREVLPMLGPTAD